MSVKVVPERVRELVAELTEPTPMRGGSVSERFMVCGKPGCACADRTEARHGPYFSLTRPVGGKTRSRLIPAKQVDLVRQQVAASRRFREKVEDYRRACEVWADAELKAHEAPAEAEAEKRGSRRTLRAKSRKKSKR